MTGDKLLLLALVGIFLTQAIFAAESEEKTGEPAKDEELAAKFVGDPILKAASKKIGDLVDGISDFYHKLNPGDDDYILPSDNNGKSDLERAQELTKFNVETDNALPDPPAPTDNDKEPVVTEWVNPAYSMSESKTNQLRKGSRRIKSYTVKGDEFKFNSPDGEEAKSRVKRGTLGAGIPDEFEFTLDALSPYDSDPAEFKIGSVIPYRLTIHASGVQTDVQVEIFSEISGGAFFMVSNVRLGSVGTNFAGYDSNAITIRYDSKYKDGRMDYATIDMGDILNSATNVDTESESQIELLFEVQALLHDSYVVGDTYRVSVGAMYESQAYVTIAQDDLTYADWTAQANPVDATFSITGPDTLNVGVTGVWTITAAVHDLYSDISLDVLAPLHQPGVMSIDRISIESVGENYQYSAVSFADGGNFTRMTYENYGNYGRLNLGTIINKGYHDDDNDVAKNTITFEVALTMLNHTVNETNPYTVGFTIWKKDQDSVEIMWSAQQGVQGEETSLPELTTSPDFVMMTSATSVIVGGRFAVLLNMTLPSSSSAKYVFEASVPVNESKAMINIEGIRMSKIGFNMPHVQYVDMPAPNIEQTDGSNTDFISWDIGAITNTGQESNSDSNTIQFELAMSLLSDASTYYSQGDSIPISLGMKHAEDYYWVGQTTIDLTENEIEYTGTQVPEFSFTNVMGADAMIFPGSAAVFDLDMIIPAGVDYAPMEMEISTAVNLTDGISKLRIVSMEIIQTGAALKLEGISDFQYTSDTGRADTAERPIYTTGNLTIDRVTSLRDENFGRYSWEDSTIRIRTIVVARTDAEAALLAEGTYWTETTVSFDESYIYAARAGIVYNATFNHADPYASVTGEVEKWQPSKSITVMEGSSNVVAPGTPVIYNVTIGVPYRTVSDILVKFQSSDDAIQVCRVRYLNSGSAIVDYDAAAYKGDIENRTNLASGYIDIAHNYKPAVTSFDYGYWNGDVRDSNVYYEIVVMPNHEATVGTNYTFATTIEMIYDTYKDDYTPAVAVVDKDAAVATLPEVYLGKYTDQADSINIGGSELFYMDIYVAPQTHHRMSVNIYAPWNSTYYGDYEIVEAVVVYAGVNLACFDYRRVTYNKTRSSDNDSGRDNVINVDLGYLPNLAETGTDTEIDANKLRIIAHVAIPANTTLSDGATIPVAATIDMSGENLWVGYINTDVVAETDTSNENTTVEPTLTVDALSDGVFDIGEIQQYEGFAVVPPGASYSQFKIIIEGGRDGDESRMKIYDMTFVSAGEHLKDATLDNIVNSYNNSFFVQDIQELDFGFLRNTAIRDLDGYDEPDLEDDVIRFSFSARLYDTQPMAGGRQFNVTSYIQYSTGSTEIEANGTREVTVVSAETTNAEFDWSVAIIDEPSDIQQDSMMRFRVDIAITDSSLRFPSDVVVHYRVPYFNELESVYSMSGIDGEYTLPTSVGQYGVDFTFDKMRYDYQYYAEFNITVDPNYVLEPGMGLKHIAIPIDVSFKRENRSQAGSYDNWYTTMKTLTFTMNIPENVASLGMDDSNVIKDCQISASSHNGSSDATNARPGLVGWTSALNRGPPLYQNEYVQVDFASKIKFTAVTIRPFDNANLDRVSKFRVKYSRLGIRWEYALDAALEPRIFDVTWPAGTNASTSVMVSLGISSFVAKHIRIVPYENVEGAYTMKMGFDLHGYSWPYGSTIQAYSCVSPASIANARAYDDRQMLAVPANQELYACVVAETGGMPYCSGTDDFGASWFALDDNVLNVFGYDPNTLAVYGLARDTVACLRSKDSGHTWKQILCSTYESVVSDARGAWVDAVALPFPLEGADSAELMTNYGTELDSGDKSWSVSSKALHGYTAAESGVAAKTADEEQVAYWGTKVWGGP